MNTLKIIHDSCAESPREWDNFGKMICFHGRYDLGDKHNYNADDYSGWEEMEKAILTDEGKGAIILPLYLYDHSAVSISTSPFSCRWDSGQIGFIVVNKKTILDNFGGKIITQKTREKAIKLLDAEVETYNYYVEGEVYGFRIVDENDDEVDSCWGFYGTDFLTNGMLEYISSENLGDITQEQLEELVENTEIEYR
jgi:hypothetical protein